MTPDADLNPSNFESIYQKATERYMLELAREWAAEDERIWRELKGEGRINVVIREIKLKGEFPDTSLEIRTYEHSRDFEHTRYHPIWRDHRKRYDEKRKRLREPEEIVATALSEARGLGE